MLFPAPLLDDLTRRLGEATGPLRVVSVPVDVDPLAFVRAGSAAYPVATYFGMPGRREIAGLGLAWQARASGPDRLPELHGRLAAAGLPADAVVPLGFSFAEDGPRSEEWAGFASATAALPMLSVTADRDGRRLTAALPAGRDPSAALAPLRAMAHPPSARIPEAAAHVIEARPSPTEWRDLVGEAVGAIKAGAYQKLVLARSVRVSGEAITDPFGIVEQLRTGRPEFYAFGWQEGDAVFLGASPELLVARSGLSVRSHPFAGTAPRGRGEDEDAALGQSLMASTKNRREHRLVTEDIAARLDEVTSDLVVPTTPSLRRMPNYHHLSTEIAGTLKRELPVLALAGMLHPTPAVGASPREALGFLDKLEPLDRGWYAGGIGWTDPRGNGEVALGLRCALVRGLEARLYAGNGIVADSDPDVELAETRLKLQALMDLLAAT